jgi:hypothetical protein
VHFTRKLIVFIAPLTKMTGSCGKNLKSCLCGTFHGGFAICHRRAAKNGQIPTKTKLTLASLSAAAAAAAAKQRGCFNPAAAAAAGRTDEAAGTEYKEDKIYESEKYLLLLLLAIIYLPLG